ncbi:hypothetical protein AAHC03_018929 [Spirometra sp. Aus1]
MASHISTAKPRLPLNFSVNISSSAETIQNAASVEESDGLLSPMDPFTSKVVYPVLASAPYDLILRFNICYSVLFFFSEYLIFLFKGLHLPYDGVVLASEVVYLFVLSAVEAIRLRFAVAGNFLERPSSTLTAVALLFINVVGCVWVAIWQSYILYLELILAVGQLAFYLAEFICGFVAFGTFLRAQ